MKVAKIRIPVTTRRRSQMVDVTAQIEKVTGGEGIREGRVLVYVPHTTAAVTINEHADPDVAVDILDHLDRMVPWERGWRHGEGNSAAHVKASLVGSAVTVAVEGGKLQLGTWQGIFFCEFDGPRQRSLWITCEAFRDF